MRYVKLPIFLIKDEFGYFSAFCPALNIAGQGKDEDAAVESFNQVLAIFLEETKRKGTLRRILEGLGWSYVNQESPKPPRTDIPSYLFSHREISIPLPS